MKRKAVSLNSSYVVLALFALLPLSSAGAYEIVLQNDSLLKGSSGTPCLCFLSGESIAVWLTAPFDGDIVELQVYWGSQFGGAPPSQESSITVFDAGVFPSAGAVLPNLDALPAIVSAPVLTDGVLNKFRFLDPPAATKPLRVPVTQGQTIIVSLELLNTNSGNAFAPTVVWDTDGCQSGKNTVFALPGGWLDACTQGVMGDWMIRAVLDPTVIAPAVPDANLGFMAVLLLVAGMVLVRRSLRANSPATVR